MIYHTFHVHCMYTSQLHTGGLGLVLNQSIKVAIHVYFKIPKNQFYFTPSTQTNIKCTHVHVHVNVV